MLFALLYCVYCAYGTINFRLSVWGTGDRNRDLVILGELADLAYDASWHINLAGEAAIHSTQFAGHGYAVAAATRIDRGWNNYQCCVDIELQIVNLTSIPTSRYIVHYCMVNSYEYKLIVLICTLFAAFAAQHRGKCRTYSSICLPPATPFFPLIAPVMLPVAAV